MDKDFLANNIHNTGMVFEAKNRPSLHHTRKSHFKAKHSNLLNAKSNVFNRGNHASLLKVLSLIT